MGHSETPAAPGRGGYRLRRSRVGEVQNRSHQASWDAGLSHCPLCTRQFSWQASQTFRLSCVRRVALPCWAGAWWELPCRTSRTRWARCFRTRCQCEACASAGVLCWLLTLCALCPSSELRRSSAARLALLGGTSGTLVSTKCGRVPSVLVQH